MLVSFMKLFSVKKQNFWSWDFSSQVLYHQDLGIIRHRIEGILLYLFYCKICEQLMSYTTLISFSHVPLLPCCFYTKDMVGVTVYTFLFLLHFSVPCERACHTPRTFLFCPMFNLLQVLVHFKISEHAISSVVVYHFCVLKLTNHMSVLNIMTSSQCHFF